jgi:hypothetical protein
MSAPPPGRPPALAARARAALALPAAALAVAAVARGAPASRPPVPADAPGRPVARPPAADSAAPTYCNPLDLDYRYNFEQLNQGISYRSGADPVIVVHRGAYYLFATLAAGWWRSADLAHWEHVRPSRWPMEDVVAPAALAVGDTIFLKPSTFAVGPILYTTRPATGRVEFYNRWMPPLPDYSGDSLPGARRGGPWDPASSATTTAAGSSTGARRTCTRCSASSSTRAGASPTSAARRRCSASTRRGTGGSASGRDHRDTHRARSPRARG